MDVPLRHWCCRGIGPSGRQRRLLPGPQATGGPYFPHYRTHLTVHGNTIPELWSSAQQVPFRKQGPLYVASSTPYGPRTVVAMLSSSSWAIHDPRPTLQSYWHSGAAAAKALQEDIQGLWLQLVCAWPMWMAAAKEQASALTSALPSLLAALQALWASLAAAVLACTRAVRQPHAWAGAQEGLLKATGLLRARDFMAAALAKHIPRVAAPASQHLHSSASASISSSMAAQSMGAAAAGAGLAVGAGKPAIPMADVAASSSRHSRGLGNSGRRWFTSLSDEDLTDEFGFSQDLSSWQSEGAEDAGPVRASHTHPRHQTHVQQQQQRPSTAVTIEDSVRHHMLLVIPKVQLTTPVLVGAAALIMVLVSAVRGMLRRSGQQQVAEDTSEQLQHIRAEEMAAQRARFRRALSTTEGSSKVLKAQPVEDWEATPSKAPARRVPVMDLDPAAAKEYSRFMRASGMDQVTDVWDSSKVADLPKVSAAEMARMTQQIRDASKGDEESDALADMAARERMLQQQLQQQLDQFKSSRRPKQEQQESEGPAAGRSHPGSVAVGKAPRAAAGGAGSMRGGDFNPFALTPEARQKWEADDHLYTTRKAQAKASQNKQPAQAVRGRSSTPSGAASSTSSTAGAVRAASGPVRAARGGGPRGLQLKEETQAQAAARDEGEELSVAGSTAEAAAAAPAAGPPARRIRMTRVGASSGSGGSSMEEDQLPAAGGAAAEYSSGGLAAVPGEPRWVTAAKAHGRAAAAGKSSSSGSGAVGSESSQDEPTQPGALVAEPLGAAAAGRELASIHASGPAQRLGAPVEGAGLPGEPAGAQSEERGAPLVPGARAGAEADPAQGQLLQASQHSTGGSQGSVEGSRSSSSYAKAVAAHDLQAVSTVASTASSTAVRPDRRQQSAAAAVIGPDGRQAGAASNGNSSSSSRHASGRRATVAVGPARHNPFAIDAKQLQGGKAAGTEEAEKVERGVNNQT